MTDLQLSCLVITLFSLIVICAYLLYRVYSLQQQCDELRTDLLKVKAYSWRVIP